MPKKSKVEKKILKEMKENRKRKGKNGRAAWYEPFDERKSKWNMKLSKENQKKLGEHCGKLQISNTQSNSAKYDKKTEKEVVKWLKTMVSAGKIKGGGPVHLQKSLQDGEVLCLLANKVTKNSVSNDIIKAHLKEGKKGKTPYAKAENKQRISAAVKGFVKAGLPEVATFCPEDLVEGKDMAAVLMCLYTLGRMCNSGDIKGGGKGIKASGQGKHNLK